jgi:hypothetical protein
MRNTQRHDNWSVMKPPTSGPKMLETPHTPLNQPCIFARSSSVKMSPMMVMASGTSAPAPRPCSARAPMSCVIDCAKPHAAEPTRNTATPIWNSRRRPKRSDSFPHTGTVTVDVSRYAEKTQL